MPNVITTDAEKFTSVVTISLAREDYENELTSKLKEVRKNAAIKGFRKGKVPMAFVRKNFGKSVFADIINKRIEKELGDALENEVDGYIGQAMPIESQTEYTFDLNNLENFEFQYEIGNKPNVVINGLDDGKEFLYHDVQVPAATIDEQIEQMRKQGGERILDEEKIVEGDMVKFTVLELDGDAIKADGVQSEFSLLWDSIADEDLKKELLTKKQGETVHLNVFNIEKDATKEHVRKYFLGLNEEDDVEVGEMYEGTITEVSRIELAELTEEFFTKTFGEKVTNEEEARTAISDGIKEQYSKSADTILFNEIRKHIEENSRDAMPLPDAYMKRWLLMTNEENTEEIIEKGYSYFADDLRWSLITNQLAEKYEIQVTEADIRASFTERLMQYMGGMAGMGDFLSQTIDRMMSDQKSVEDTAKEIVTNRVLSKLKEEVKLKKEKVTTEQFQNIIKELNEKNQALRAAEEEEE